MKKKLNELSKYEFDKLKAMGMLWVIYPESSGIYENITNDEEIDINSALKDCLPKELTE